ncbi:MAG: glycosyltransferase family 4 protein, partial [bacterium]|nr:glycosyltransferase family 4 protein [bacterium]
MALFLIVRPEYFTTQHNVALDFEKMELRHMRNSAPILLTTSYLSHERLRDTYASADAYVMPSNEGFGLTLLEAMSCSTPAIGLNHGAVSDFVNDRNGFLVPAGRRFISKDMNALPTVGDHLCAPDVRGLRKVMRCAFEQPEETRRLGEQARKDCEARYTWDHVASEMAEVVRSVHAGSHGSRTAGRRKRVARIVKGTLSWVLLCMDDEDITGALSDLRVMSAADDTHAA